MATLVIRGGRIIDARGERRGDVLVDGSRIIAVGDGLSGDRELDASGCIVSPGLVDIQVHFREPGMTEAEDIETGARGAALGGNTACVLMPNTTPCIDNPDVVREVLAIGAASICDVRTSAAMSVDRGGEQLVDFQALYDAGVRVFTDDGWSLADSLLMRRAFEATRNLRGAVLSQHAEEPSLVDGGAINEGAVSQRLGLPGRPREAEEIIVARDISLARLTGGRYHVLHTSTSLTVDLVAKAKADGLRVTAEVTPQHLCLTDEDVERLGTNGKMNPPLRTQGDVEALRSGLANGTIDAVATDHAPHPPRLKALPLADAPPGMIGTETAMAVVFTEMVATGLLSEQAALAALSWKPAQIAGIEDHGRPVAEGEPANLVVIDPTATWTVDAEKFASKSRNSPFIGRTLTGRVRHTVLRGEAVVIDTEAQR